MHPRSVWLLAAPLIAASSVVAHALAYRLAGANAGTVAGDDTHGYFAHLPLLVAPAAAAALAALVLRAVSTRRGERPRPLPWWPFAVAPALGFALQEHVEHAAAHGKPASAVGPALAVGVALSIPLGLAALVAARALLAAADRSALASSGPHEWLVPPPAVGAPRQAPRTPSAAPSARRPTGRGPPLGLAV